MMFVGPFLLSKFYHAMKGSAKNMPYIYHISFVIAFDNLKNNFPNFLISVFFYGHCAIPRCNVGFLDIHFLPISF